MAFLSNGSDGLKEICAFGSILVICLITRGDLVMLTEDVTLFSKEVVLME